MNIRTITFDQIKKLDDKGNFDLSATLGEFVKLTYNNHPSETLQDGFKLRIRGNLQVDLRLNRRHEAGSLQVWILSDDIFDRVSLQWLSPWLDEVESPINQPHDIHIAVTVDLPKFERQFILPFITEFTAQLSGQNPLEYLLLKHVRSYLLGNEIHAFDRKVSLSPSLDEKTGCAQLTLRDGSKLVGMNQINIKVKESKGFFANALENEVALLAPLERSRQSELKTHLHEDRFIDTVLADTAWSVAKHADEKYAEPVTPQEILCHSLYLLILAYRSFRKENKHVCLFEPFRKKIVNHILNVILPAMTVEKLMKRQKLFGPTVAAVVAGRVHFYLDTTHLENLMVLGDGDIFKGVVLEMKKRNLDINNLGGIPWSCLNYLDEVAHFSLIERRMLLNALFDAGVKFTPELEKEMQEIPHAMQEPVKQAALTHVAAEDEQKSVVKFSEESKAHDDGFKNVDIEKSFWNGGLSDDDSSERKECSDEKAYQIKFMKWLFQHYQSLFVREKTLPGSSSGCNDEMKVIASHIVSCLLPSIKMRDLSQDLVCSLLNFPDRVVFDGVLAKVCEANSDLNTAFDRHLLLWLVTSMTCNGLSEAENQKRLQQLFEKGLLVTEEIMKKATKGNCFTKEGVQLFMSVFYPHYERIVALFATFLSADPSSIVMRYLVCDEFVNKVVKVLPSTVERASQNRNSFLTTMTEAGSPGDSPGAAPLHSPRAAR